MKLTTTLLNNFHASAKRIAQVVRGVLLSCPGRQPLSCRYLGFGQFYSAAIARLYDVYLDLLASVIIDDDDSNETIDSRFEDVLNQIYQHLFEPDLVSN